MKKVSRSVTVLSTIFFAFLFFSCTRISVELDIPQGGILEDAILIASDNGNAPRTSYILGDIDLSEDELNFSHKVDTSIYTHWWLIGSMNESVVFSSVLALSGADMYSIEPYSGNQYTWDIPNNLDAFANSSTYSIDWWAQTVNNHSSHVAKDGSFATLWRFNNGVELGKIKFQLADSD